MVCSGNFSNSTDVQDVLTAAAHLNSRPRKTLN